jgi:LysM repeat protein
LEPFDFDAINLSPLSLLPEAVVVPPPFTGEQPLSTRTPTRTVGCVPRADWTFTYRVPFGDTLSGIASRIGMSTAALAEGNCITNANILIAGQVIRTPREVPYFVYVPPHTPTHENPVCGDGVCEMGENTDSCAVDCAPAPVCGNGVCEDGENGTTCAVDCIPTGPYCGDGTCGPGEDYDSCSVDCPPPSPPPPTCGDGSCVPPEDSLSCPSDCG